MNLFNKIAQSLDTQNLTTRAQQISDNSGYFIEITKTAADSFNEIAITMVFDTTAEILENIVIHERPNRSNIQERLICA